MIGPTAFTFLLILLAINPCLIALVINCVASEASPYHTLHIVDTLSNEGSPYCARSHQNSFSIQPHEPTELTEKPTEHTSIEHSQNLANMPTCSLVDLDDDKVDHLLDEHVPKGHLSPKKLFRVKENSNGTCSNWAAVKIHSALISDVLEATEGQLLRHKKFSQQLGSWLKKNGEDWCKSDIETSADGLRIMMRSLKALKSDDRSPPAAYSCLKALLEK